ncbi:MAG TPA: alpha/beta hydrolase [Conexibacter sp.]|jgi:pimeloyl-ACP methyl ester carboxylesterase|nr:alpha/beta hydrolase [Conexibacter sp.]
MSAAADTIASNGGEQLYDVGRGIELCCETFGDRSDPPLVLVMGLGMQMVHWPLGLIARLVERGLFVVRFDNRDRGRSTHVAAPPPTRTRLVTRRFGPEQYTLEDMALDTAGLLDALELDSVHLAGVSMGGMIAQTLAASRPRRVRSLVSIMSTTGSRRAGQPKPHVYPLLLRPAPRERDAFVEHQLRVLSAIGAPGDVLDTPEGRAFVAGTHDRDPNVSGTGRQLAAILASGDRTAALRGITAPTLVIHGEADPLITPSGGRATARAIPGARLMLVPGMGHGLPERLWPQLVDAVAEHVADAERRRAAAVAGA